MGAGGRTQLARLLVLLDRLWAERRGTLVISVHNTFHEAAWHFHGTAVLTIYEPVAAPVLTHPS